MSAKKQQKEKMRYYLYKNSSDTLYVCKSQSINRNCAVAYLFRDFFWEVISFF